MASPRTNAIHFGNNTNAAIAAQHRLQPRRRDCHVWCRHRNRCAARRVAVSAAGGLPAGTSGHYCRARYGASDNISMRHRWQMISFGDSGKFCTLYRPVAARGGTSGAVSRRRMFGVVSSLAGSYARNGRRRNGPEMPPQTATTHANEPPRQRRHRRRVSARGSAENAKDLSVQGKGGSGKAGKDGRGEKTEDVSKAARLSWESLLRWSRRRRLSQDSTMSSNRDVLGDTNKVCVFGGGSFGTAMAVVVARNKPSIAVSILVRSDADARSINDEHVNERYLPKHVLPRNVTATTSPEEALDGADYIVHAVPVQSSTEFLKPLSRLVPKTVPILSVSKGLELGTTRTMQEVIPRALGNTSQPVVCLSGPTFASEVMEELPTVIVAASNSLDLAWEAQQLLACDTLRVNTSDDVIGVEMAGALKNVLAIAAGIVEGLELGHNAMAALVAQGCSEIRWICEKMGASNATISGPAGVGDIMLTCFVSLSRNRSVGVRLGRGEPLDIIVQSSSQVAEGVATAEALVAVARRNRVSLPVLTAVARIVQQELTPREAVDQLMKLPQIQET